MIMRFWSALDTTYWLLTAFHQDQEDWPAIATNTWTTLTGGPAACYCAPQDRGKAPRPRKRSDKSSCFMEHTVDSNIQEGGNDGIKSRMLEKCTERGYGTGKRRT